MFPVLTSAPARLPGCSDTVPVLPHTEPHLLHMPAPPADILPAYPDIASHLLHIVCAQFPVLSFSDPVPAVLHPASWLSPYMSYQILSALMPAPFFPDLTAPIRPAAAVSHSSVSLHFPQSELFHPPAPVLRPELLSHPAQAPAWPSPVSASLHESADPRHTVHPRLLSVHFQLLLPRLPVLFWHPPASHWLHSESPDNGSHSVLLQYPQFAAVLLQSAYHKHRYTQSDCLLLLLSDTPVYIPHRKNLPAGHRLPRIILLFPVWYFPC